MRTIIISQIENYFVKLVWIEECRGGVYIGYYGSAKKIHQSYHQDGAVHLKVGSKYLSMFKGEPIRGIKLFASLGSHSFTLDNEYRFAFDNYQRIKNASAIIYISPDIIKRKRILNVDAYILHKNSEKTCFEHALNKMKIRGEGDQGFQLLSANFFKLELFSEHILGIFLYGGD